MFICVNKVNFKEDTKNYIKELLINTKYEPSLNVNSAKNKRDEVLAKNKVEASK